MGVGVMVGVGVVVGVGVAVGVSVSVGVSVGVAVGGTDVSVGGVVALGSGVRVEVDVTVGNASRACGVRVATETAAAEVSLPDAPRDGGSPEASPFVLQPRTRPSSRSGARC
jgi:hypothetical protein